MNENKMIKRKCSSDEAQEKNEEDDDENVCVSYSIPLPIQTFLWRQTSPFLRPKISKLQDAAAMEQREACKLFEKVLVQNIRFGLSPSLTKAITSVSRWRLIVSALPHVMHCCSALLYARRKSSFDKLSASETKLLYTLHWILLDAAEECADEENERGLHRPPEHYLLPITTIQTFVFLFAPLIPHLKQSDFLTSFRLENGYKIWIPLFNYCHPEIPSFLAHAKRNTFSLSRTAKKIAVPKFGDVFIGSSSTDKSNTIDIKQDLVNSQNDSSKCKDSYDIFGGESPNHELSSRSDLKKKYEYIKKDLSEPSLATYLDVAVLRCLFTSQWIEDGIDWALNFLYHRLECIYKSKENQQNFRIRSYSLPVPKRKFKESLFEQQPESKRNRPNDYSHDFNNKIDQDSKLKTFRDIRRSSFSGLPGLSGFQALISSTSSASFGRHGSEKVKHKKLKKQLHQPQNVNVNQINVKTQSHHKISYSPSSKYAAESSSSTNKHLAKLMEKSSKTNKIKEKDEHQTICDSLQTNRPNSANSFKNRKISLSETHLIDRDDLKGKSMPTLHLIDDEQKKCPFVYLTPEVVRTPSRTSLVETSSTQPNVPFPIITITEHSPVASMQFFNNSNNNKNDEMKKYSNSSKYKFYIADDENDQQSQQSSAWKPFLFRCKSDAQINYTIETSGESLASINYVNKNGQLSLVIILKAIHSITLKDSVCSTRICRMIHKIINKLMSFKLLSKRFKSIYNAKKYKTFKPNCENLELSVHHLFMDTLFRIIKQLGCSRGCGEGRREVEAIRLKENVMKTLKILYEMSEIHFLQYCEMLVTSHPIQEIMDIFHAFFGFCSELPPTTTTTGKTSSHLTTVPMKKSLGIGFSGAITFKNGYYNNFGAGFPSNNSSKRKVKIEVDAIIVKCTFKPFISRLVFVQKELKVQENMSLYCEIRQFISYVRDHHGGIFRNVALSGLIESTKFILNNDKLKMAFKDLTTSALTTSADNQQQQTTTSFRSNINDNNERMNIKKHSELPAPPPPPPPPPPVSSSTNVTNRSKSTNFDYERLQMRSNDQQQQEWTTSHQELHSTTSLSHRNQTLPQISNQMDEQSMVIKSGFGDQSKKTNQQQLELQQQQQQQHQQRFDFLSDSMMINNTTTDLMMISNNDLNQENTNNNLQNYLAISDLQQPNQQQTTSTVASDKFLRRGSFSRQTLKGFSNQPNFMLGMNQKSTFFKARKQFKNVFGKNKMKQNSFDETPDLSRKNSLEFDRLQEGNTLLPSISLKKTKTILLEILKDGMLKFQFLLDSCTPGTIPDAQLIAAMLDLKAPVLARAAFLLECCHFVHRCNRGQWPGWMRTNFNFFRPSGPRSGSQTVIKSRASTTLQKYAGRCFYQWAELLSSRLEGILQNDIDSAGQFSDDHSYQTQIEEEDFFSVSCIDSKETNCPFALKIIACQLLYEITTYLRETHQYLLSKGSSRRTSVVNKERNVCVEPSKHPISMNRRWSMALSNVNFKDSSAQSLMSLANIAGPSGPIHILDHCMVPANERRISFVLHEAEIENDSNSLVDSNEDILHYEKKRLSQVGPVNLSSWTGRSGSGHESFRRRSIKLKKNDNNKKQTTKLRSATLVEDDYKSMFKRSNSLRSKRKISGASEKSDTSERFSGEESPGLVSDEGHFESMIDSNLDANDSEMIENIPWLKITTLFASAINFECNHNSCMMNCHKKIIQTTSFLTKEVQRIYEKDIQPLFDFDLMAQKLLDDKEDVTKKEKKLKKILMGHASPLKRKASGLNMDKLDRDSHGHSVYSSTTGLAHAAIDVEHGLYESEDPRLIFHDVLNYRMESKQEENTTMLYILNQVKNPFHSIISMMLKSALILNRGQFEYLLNISWNLILDEDIQISSSASVAIIVCSLKCPDIVVNLLNKDLNHQNVDIRVNAINKFLRIWCNRHQCWQRLEEGAHLVLKLPPAAIEFTLPSPRIALECKPVVDPPYMPIVKTKVDEVAINQEPSIQKSFVAATKTRRKQQIELISKALQDQEDKLREERENYRFNSVPVTLQAAYEPVLYHTIEEHDDNEDDIERIPLHHLQVAQCFFPSSLTTASFLIVNLLEDTQINSEGYAVYDVAYKTIWHCLSEDSALFLRNLLEKLTREKKTVVIQIIRRLIRFMPRLPAQAAFTLYNYLIGFIMYHVRTPTEESQEIIASVMSILWLIVPNVFGLFLKDLKQILRKEQCDATILITANVPSAKKIIVHGPDPGSIPSQFPVHEDTQFSQILTDSLDFFGIDESKHNEYFLVDTKTNQIHNLNAFVRDFYFFKRSQYPQISLVHMNPIEAYDKFQRQAFTLQFTELGKCLMTLSLIKTSFLGIQRVLFLHEELMKLPSFPRKALETNLTLYTGPMGREVLGIDTLHKISWVKLVARMFEATSGFFADSSDIHLFLNVINGTLLLHCEDASILRLCMATYINAAHQFKNIFATNGYLLIVQTIVQIYGTHQTNSLLCRTIEFVFKQFYILHSKPFVLQMFGAVAPLLDTDSSSKYETTGQIQSKAFFQLIQSLGQYTADPLDILELVDAEKPLKALDFCYQMDSETLTVLDSISLCVTVISYAPDSERGHQMLTILDSILPFHLMHMQTLTTKKETPGRPRAELDMILNISGCIKTLIYNCEALTRNFTGPQRSLDIRETSIKNAIEIDEDSHSKYNPDSYYPQRHNRIELDDGELSRMEFRKPRDLLLKIVSEFLTKSTIRFAELSKKISEIHAKNSSYDLLDVKCHIRLAEIAHSLLKLAPYDPQTMACKGLVRYMNEILPNSEWRQESMRPALIMVLRRLDKTFAKISKKTAIKRTTDWEAARRLLKGVYLTFTKHPYIVHLPHLKSLINVCQNIILGDQTSYLSDSSSSAVSSWTTALSQAPPPGFTSVAVRLISLQMIQLGDSQSLETICSGAFSSPEKSEIYLMNMIYPMCIRTTSGMKDTPKFRQCDINFVLNVILNILKPINSKPTKGSDSSQAGVQLKQFSLQQIGFLGLKILITCFEKQLNSEWYHIAKCIRDLADKPHLIGSTFWNFIDFISTYRTPLFVLILPYIKCKYLLKTCESEIEQLYQTRIREKLCGGNLPFNRSKGNLYVSLVNEMKSLREDIIRRKNNPNIDERSKSIVQEQNSSDKPENSGHRLSFAFSQLAASASKLSNISSNIPNTVSVNVTQQQQPHNKIDQPSPSPTATTSTMKPRVLRGLSFRLSSDSRRLASRGLSVKLASNQSEKKMFSRRTSYPDHPDIDRLKPPEPSGSEPKLFRKLTVNSKNFKQKGSISFSGETLADNIETRKETSFIISSANNNKESEQTIKQKQQRFQRQQQKNQNRRSLRFKKISNSSEEQSSSSWKSMENSELENNKKETMMKVPPSMKSSCDNENINLIHSCCLAATSTSKQQHMIHDNHCKQIQPIEQQTNINLYSINNCDNKCVTNKIFNENNNALQLKSQMELNNNNTMIMSTISATISNNNIHNNHDDNNNRDCSMQQQQITNNTSMSPYESTINAIPFADEET